MHQSESSEYGNPIRVRLTRWDLIGFNLLLTPRFRATWVVWTTIALVVAVAQLAFGGVPKSTAGWIAAAIVGVLAATAASVVGFIISLVFVLVTSGSANGVLGEHVYSFQADGLREQTSANDTVVKWGGARDAHRIGAFILINVGPALFHVLPRRCFASAAEYDAFWEMTQRLKPVRRPTSS